MLRIRKAISNFFKEDHKVMGRWTIVYCPTTIKNTVDRTNEDHCGPCAQYELPSKPTMNQKPEPLSTSKPLLK